MSVGLRLETDEVLDVGLYELLSILGERDTAKLFEDKFTVDTKHSIAAGGGNSVDRRIVYIDEILHQQVKDNEFKATGLEPDQIITAWCLHEHAEITIVDGDNPVDTYYPAHKRGLAIEHWFYRLLGCEPKKVEKVIWPALVACYARPIKKPALDLWCAPYLDNATERDEELLAEMQKAGVRDAFKRSKYDAHYAIGEYACRDCRNKDPKALSQEDGEIFCCQVVCGIVRHNRHCDYFIDEKLTIKQAAELDDEDKLAHEAVSYGHGRDGEFCRTCKYSDHKAKPNCALVREIEPSGWCRLWADD